MFQTAPLCKQFSDPDSGCAINGAARYGLRRCVPRPGDNCAGTRGRPDGRQRWSARRGFWPFQSDTASQWALRWQFVIWPRPLRGWLRRLRAGAGQMLQEASAEFGRLVASSRLPRAVIPARRRLPGFAPRAIWALAGILSPPPPGGGHVRASSPPFHADAADQACATSTPGTTWPAIGATARPIPGTWLSPVPMPPQPNNDASDGERPRQQTRPGRFQRNAFLIPA